MKSLFLSVAAALCLPTNPASAKIVEGIVAIVNNEIITLSDIEAYKKKLAGGSMVDDLLVDPKKVPELIKNRNELINTMINEKLLASEVKKQGLEITYERVDKEIRSISGQNGLSKDQLVAALRAQGVNFSDYQDFIKTRIERQSLIEQTVTSKIKISDEEISSYYLSQSGRQAQRIAATTVAHIFLKTPDKAQLVMEKLKGGETFEKLASLYSEDENFSEGGLLGTFKPGELAVELDRAMGSVAVGEFSDVIQTKRGYHILKVVKRNLVSDPAWEGEKNRIRGILYQQAFKKQFQFWLDQKRREAFIRINDVG